MQAQQNQNPEAGQTSMGRDGQIFMYNPDYLREQFAGLVIQRGLPFTPTFDHEQNNECVPEHYATRYTLVQQNEATQLTDQEIALDASSEAEDDQTGDGHDGSMSHGYY
ncbi:hypothetical protein Tco_0241568 [Tanacetum coccineum]